VTSAVRLKEERNRLRYNQTDFAAIGGVSKKTQIDYEKGTTSPTGVYLSAIAAIGADVNYILTGQRVANTDSVLPRSEGEAIAMLYAQLDDAGKADIKKLMEEKKQLAELIAQQKKRA